MIASLVMAVLGLALMGAPALLGYEGTAASVHHVAGPVIAAFGIVAVAEVSRPARRAILPVGLLLAAAPFLVDHPLPAAAAAVVIGLGSAALAIAPVATAAAYAGGWTALFDTDRLAGTPDGPAPDDPDPDPDPRPTDPEPYPRPTPADPPQTDRQTGGTLMNQPTIDETPDRSVTGSVAAAAGSIATKAAAAATGLGDGPAGAPRRRVVVVTGASAGVGRAIAHAFAERGDRVGLVARDGKALEEVVREVEERGGEAIPLPLDVASAQAVDAAADRVEAELGPIDVWVNNAMVSVFAPVHETTADEYRRVTEVTYLGYVHGTLSALRRMRPRDRGTIIQIGSALAYRSIPLQSAYCAAKHAINGFTESLRTELLHDGSGVSVTLVQLPAVNTPQFDWVRSRLPNRPQPVPPIFQPEVVGEAVAWVADHPRRELVIGASAGVAILADKLAPGIADRYLAKGGYESQQTDEPEDPDRRDNLWEPVHGLHRTHGRFDDRARAESPNLWLSRHVGATGAVAAAVALGGLAAAAMRLRDR